MYNRSILHWTIAAAVTLVFLARDGLALVKFDQEQDQIFVSASASVGWDSNIDARNGGASDVISTASLGMEYARHAGYIGIDASVGWNIGQFTSHKSYNYFDPTANVVFSKKYGRATGSLSLGAARSSSADTVIGMRTDSWTYTGDLAWKYPVITRYSFSGDFSYSQTDYQGGNAGIYNLDTYGSSLHINYDYTSLTQFFGGYSVLLSDTAASTQTWDHSFIGGISGTILPKVTGSISAGYSFRQDQTTGQLFDSWTASASTAWKINHFFTLSGALSKNFTTAADASSIDSLNALLTLQYQMTPHWSFFTDWGGGRNRFLTGLAGGRVEDYGTWGVGATYIHSDHFKVSLSYNLYQDWSNQSSADYNIQTLTLTVFSRW